MKTFIVLLFVSQFSNFYASNQAKKGLDLNCIYAGHVYYPDRKTACRCTWFLTSKCESQQNSDKGGGIPLPEALHPLDPLTENEIRMTKEIILKSQEGQNRIYVFNTITLYEPPKMDFLQFYYSNTVPTRNSYNRKSFSVLWNNDTGRVYEAVVNLDKGAVESFVEMPEKIRVPLLSPDDAAGIESAVKADPKVIRKCVEYGLTNMELVYVSPWPLGPRGYVEHKPEYAGIKRPYECYMYFQNFKDDNPYAHPLPFVVVVDGVGPRVVNIEMLPTHEEDDMGANRAGNTIPKMPANYDTSLRRNGSAFLRKEDKPIKVTSPLGPSYKVTGNLIEWQKFKIRIGFNAREGPILYNVLYQDGKKLRPILYRASVAEMGVFYGDPRPPSHMKYAFDTGDAGAGFRANNQRNPVDCIGATTFFSYHVNDNDGNPVEMKNVICITEEDAGLLWKHTDLGTGKGVGTRSHRLSIINTVTTGNYDVVFTWSFYQDASIQFNLKLTGLLSTNMMAVGATPGRFGSVVFPQVNAQVHQHTTALRLDTEIDGNANSIQQVDIQPIPEPSGSRNNQFGNGFTAFRTPLKTQLEGCSKVNSTSGRIWIITNTKNINPYSKQPVGWKLMPSNTPEIMMDRDSPILNSKLEFLKNHLWVTRYQEGPQYLYPGGFYWEDGLPQWVRRDPEASIEDTDIVLWHMFNPLHIPRVEDFPIMPVEQYDIWLKPYNFFCENPAQDVPSSLRTGRGKEL